MPNRLRPKPVHGARKEAFDAERRRIAKEVERHEAGIRAYLEDPELSGETLQKLRQLRSDISLADEELKRAQVK